MMTNGTWIPGLDPGIGKKKKRTGKTGEILIKPTFW